MAVISRDQDCIKTALNQAGRIRVKVYMLLQVFLLYFFRPRISLERVSATSTFEQTVFEKTKR